jgi:hypothetical protein
LILKISFLIFPRRGSTDVKPRLPVIVLVLLCFSPTGKSFAQEILKVTVTGRVVDDSTGAPLPLTNIFISNSTIGAAADSNGRFVLRGVPVGNQQIVASIVGYKPASASLRLADSSTQEVRFRLRASPVQLQTVEVEAKDPVEWKKDLDRFIKAFIGSSTHSPECSLLNPQVLDFSYGEDADKFVATARAPLEIENRALGYHITCNLLLFVSEGEGLQFMSLNAFRPLKPGSTIESERWAINRRSAYFGSKRHFLISLIKKKVKQEGFEVFSVRREWVQTALRRASGFDVDVGGILRPGETPLEWNLRAEDLLQVIYTNGVFKQYSVFELRGGSQVIFANGFCANPLGLQTYGYWSTQRAAEMLPIDYEPE